MDLLSVEFLETVAFPAKGIRAIMVRSSNGGYIGNNGSSRELSHPTDLKWLLAHRYVSDAILVGSETAILEKYQPISCPPEFSDWRTKNNLKKLPLLITATRDSQKLEVLLAISDYVITTREICDIQNPKILSYGETEIDWKLALDHLNELGIIRITCEGGPALVEQLLNVGLIDQFALTQSNQSGIEQTYQRINTYLETTNHTEVFAEDGFTFSYFGTLPTWEELLTVGEYFVLRDAGTQAPFSVAYEKKPAAGYYTCRSCGTRLFDATDQFDARCGWPAFWKPNDQANLILEDDNSKGYLRVEVKCGSCNSHLGHVFHGEGFGFPTDDRYCINAICLVRKYD